ncbi:MAG: hypothetical protein WC758_08100 [Candidatus Woesearchaeota archaeon]|jgi:hypothetical protein
MISESTALFIGMYFSGFSFVISIFMIWHIFKFHRGTESDMGSPVSQKNKTSPSDTLKEIEKEVLRLDKKLHKERNAFCPKCKKKMHSFAEVEEHIKETKHYGDYASSKLLTDRDSYTLREYDKEKAKLEGFKLACKQKDEESYVKILK